MKFDDVFKIKVIPNSKKTELLEKEGQLRLYLKAVPEKGKANREVVRFFKKELGLRVRILKGEKNREKVLKLIK